MELRQRAKIYEYDNDRVFDEALLLFSVILIIPHLLADCFSQVFWILYLNIMPVFFFCVHIMAYTPN